VDSYPPLVTTSSLGRPRPLDVDALERAAAAVLSERDYYDFASGTGAMITLAENRAAFLSRRVVPRPLTDPGPVRTGITLLGARLEAPVYIAPMARQGRAAKAGELASAAVAAELGALFIASTRSSFSLEEIAAHCAGPRWFQLYVMRDRGITRDLVRRATEAGYGAVVVTIDGPVAGTRWRRFDGDEGKGTAGEGSDNLARYFPGPQGALIRFRSVIEDQLSWDDIEQLAVRSALPVVVKGVLHPDDARRAIASGVAAVVVSNHGGRMLDRSPASLDVLPDVVAAVDGRVPVLMDGGVRDGGDVLIACATGADCAGIGRPIIWALATGGADGVRDYLSSVVEDLNRSLTLAGVRSPGELPADQLVSRSRNSP
jgi:4-hydroxymandelate oxidase